MKPGKKRMIRSAALILGAMLCLAGCAGENRAKGSETVPEATQVLLLSNSENADIAEATKVLNYPIDGKAGIYSGTPIDIEMGGFSAFLTTQGDSAILSESSSQEGTEEQWASCTSGARFRIFRYKGTDYNTGVYYDNEQLCQFYDAYNIYRGEQFYQTDPGVPGDWMFQGEQDFSFATVAQAQAEILEALEPLGLGELACNRVRCIDHNGMEELGKLLSTDEAYALAEGENLAGNGYPLKDNWSADDDCYVFSFSTSVHGVPMSYRDETRQTYDYRKNEIVVFYTKDGIIRLYIDLPWAVGNCLQQPRELITPEKILEQTEKIYGDAMDYPTTSVDLIRLEYQYRQGSGGYELFPVWVVTVSQDLGGEIRDLTYLQFDALTGARM